MFEIDNMMIRAICYGWAYIPVLIEEKISLKINLRDFFEKLYKNEF